MFWNRAYVCGTRVLEQTSSGVILEIRFEGEDDVSRGDKIQPYIRNAIEEHRPAAIVLNLVGCRQIFDNDVGCMSASFSGRGMNLPYFIVARGAAERSLRTLLQLAKLDEVFDISVLESVDAALAQARQAATGNTA